MECDCACRHDRGHVARYGLCDSRFAPPLSAGPAGVGVSSPVTAWDVAGIFGEDLRLTLVEPQAGLSIRKVAYPVGGAWNIEARGLDVGRLFDVRRDDHPLLDGGIADGSVDLQASTDALRFHVGMGARGARLGALADNADDEPQLGDPTDVTIRFDGGWRRIGGTMEIPEVHTTVAGAALSGSITCCAILDTRSGGRSPHLLMQPSGLRATAGCIRARGAESLQEWRPAPAVTLARSRSTCVYADAWRTLPRSR